MGGKMNRKTDREKNINEMNKGNREGNMLPPIVEKRMQEAYASIRSGEIGQIREQGEKKMNGKANKQMRKKRKYGRWAGIAAALLIVVAVPSVVYAAVVYFQKDAKQEEGRMIYDFSLNYQLTPGEYEVTPAYLPEGMEERGSGKYYGGDSQWITVMPIYTMAELEKANRQIVVENMEQVEHTVLSGMEADVITFREAEKYRANTYLFLFNEREGCVIHIVAGYEVSRDELLKFADSLSVVRTGDGSYETEDEKAARIEAEKEAERQALETAETGDVMVELGIPQEKIYGIGGELRTYDGAYGYTVTGYEFLDSLEGFAQEGFFDFSRFDGWLDGDKTLRPYLRQHYDPEGRLLSEEMTEQEILRVDIDLHCYDDQWEGVPIGEAPLDFQLDYVEKNKDGTYTWALDEYAAVPSEEYWLQMDNSAVYLNVASHTEGEERKDFFFRSLGKGETIRYTLLFVVDKDRRDDFLLSPVGSNYSRWQHESMTVEECRDELDGYIRLQ